MSTKQPTIPVEMRPEVEKERSGIKQAFTGKEKNPLDCLPVLKKWSSDRQKTTPPPRRVHAHLTQGDGTMMTQPLFDKVTSGEWTVDKETQDALTRRKSKLTKPQKSLSESSSDHDHDAVVTSMFHSARKEWVFGVIQGQKLSQKDGHWNGHFASLQRRNCLGLSLTRSGISTKTAWKWLVFKLNKIKTSVELFSCARSLLTGTSLTDILMKITSSCMEVVVADLTFAQSFQLFLSCHLAKSCRNEEGKYHLSNIEF